MSTRDVNRLDPVLQPLLRKLLNEAKFGDWSAFMTDGFRSFKEQDELYARGRTKPGKIVTNAKGGQSKHNHGLAFDIAFKNKYGAVIWDVGLLTKAGKIGKKLGLTWGGDWKSFRDYPHFELNFDEAFTDKWEGKFILDVEDHGRVYYVHKGQRHYVSPHESLQKFAKKFATGFLHINVMRIQENYDNPNYR